MALEEKPRGADGLMSRLEAFVVTDESLAAIAVVAVQAFAAAAAALVGFKFSATVDYFTYNACRDVSLLVIIGLAFLFTYLRRYGLSAIGYSLLMVAVVVQLSFIGEYALNKGTAQLTLDNVVRAMFCVGAVLISFAAVLGKVTPVQVVIMAAGEVFTFWVNYRVFFTEIVAHDVGGGIFIFLFGACFGMAVSAILTDRRFFNHDLEASSAFSDKLALVGTILVWVLFPSFTSAMATTQTRQALAISNTMLSLCSSAIAFAALSRLVHSHRFSPVHLQRATLAGGVAIAVVADTDIGAYGAMLVGTTAGALAVVLYIPLVKGWLLRFFFHDTFGVTVLFGACGLLSAIVSFAAFGKFENMDVDKAGLDKTKGFTGIQADDQFVALLVTLGIAIAGGGVVGLIMRLIPHKLGYSDERHIFSDAPFFDRAKVEIPV